mgnify:CR=1 FL=1
MIGVRAFGLDFPNPVGLAAGFDKNAEVFWAQLGRFSYLAFAFIVIAVYKFYLTQLLEMRWRAWMPRNPRKSSPRIA